MTLRDPLPPEPGRPETGDAESADVRSGGRESGESAVGEHVWARPVPVIGDTSSAAQRADSPDGWAFSRDVQEALWQVIGARRDIRRFRPDPVPDELVRKVIEAGHAGPSVGHSQPWRFIVVSEADTRERVAHLADQQRLRQAGAMTSERGAQLLDLKLEGIREAPLGIVVACDRRAPATGVLGRATFTDADMWSCAAAIENMWLTSRAAGLGMGWVTLMRPDDLAELLGLPEGVETLGWLCLGWPDELPPGPGLQRRAWSSKLPLDEVILHERWPADHEEPARPVSHLRAPDQRRTVAATDRADRLLTTPGSLGVLDLALDKVEAAGRGNLDGGTLVLACADHPVHELGVSAFEQSVTYDIAEAAGAGRSVGAVTAAAHGFSVEVVDCGVGLDETDTTALPNARHVRPRGRRGNLVHADALTGDDTERLVTAGHERGAALAGEGLVMLGEAGIGNTTPASALAAAMTGLSAGEAVGLGSSSDSAMVARKVEVVSGALSRAGVRPGEKVPASISSMRLLAALGGGELAYLYGVVLGAAENSGVVVLDGLAGSVPALLAVREHPAVGAYLVAGQASREAAHRAVLGELGLEPLLDLRLRAGEGVGAVMAGSLLRGGLRVRREAARTVER